jgi:N12 class adenine-specific DNA methylase
VIEAEERSPTPDEQRVLARWSGWGAVPEVFDPAAGRFATLRGELAGLLDEEAFAAAARNTLNAHYTDAAYASAIWEALAGLGFDGGDVLEPGCGAGVFLGLAPETARPVGIELDPTTAAIAALLYPDATILAESFAANRFGEGSFDLVVGNVPFGRFVLHDPVHNGAGHSIHNHFILKSLRLTRPGGLVALLTSRYSLDARNPGARREMAELGDLVAALRLPGGAHRRAAGTDVVTDLVIFRRRLPGEEGIGEAFERATAQETESGLVEVNEYFVAHSDHVLGRLGRGDGPYRGDEVVVEAVGDPAEALRAALAKVVVAARGRGLTCSPRVRAAATPPPLPRRDGAEEGRIEEAGEAFTIVEGGRVVPHAVPRTQAAELRALLGLRDGLRALLEAEAATRVDTPELVSLRVELNRRYDAYVARFGPINRSTWRRTGRVDPETGEARLARFRPGRGGFRADPLAAAVDALEVYDAETNSATKAPILSRRVVAPLPSRLGVDDPADALAICLDDHGEVRLTEVARLLGVDEGAARAALRGLAFDEPGSDRLVPAAEYLSGNVREKLAAATAAAEEDDRYRENVTALAGVLPVELGPAEIEARLGAAWIDASYVQDFLRELLDDPRLVVEHPGGGVWAVRGGREGVAARATWGTERRPAGDLAESLLTQAVIRVNDTLPDGTRVANLEETLAARDKAAELAERFATWCWEDPSRADALARAYNDAFNAIVLRSYDGAAPALPGLALSFEPRPHQLAAVARIVAEPAVLLAHEVGAGKTAAMVMGAMELRRLGLATKPAFVVPNHMVGQFAREAAQLYPLARLLVGEEVHGPEARRSFVARAATGEWDAVIMSQSLFERIPLGREHQLAYLTDSIERLATWLARSKDGAGLTVKRLQRKLLEQEEKLKAKLDSGKEDRGVSFELTGIDYLFVDEAHLYKNLHTASNIPAANIAGSERAQDLDMKLSWLRRRKANGRVVTFATATPIANSITEAYVVQSYLRPDLLRQAGIEDFDSWAATFAEVVTGVELAPEGGFRNVSRFARFTNVPELLRLLAVPADVKTAADLGLPTPALVGGGPETVAVPASAELAELVADLARRAEAVRARRVGPEEDNMLAISNDGRLGALDLRLVGRERPEGPTKLDVAADRIAAIWAEHRSDRFLDEAGEPHPRPGALQIVFSDLGTPKDAWNVYDQLRKDLVARGMEASSIRFVHEARDDRAKQDLFRACRSGSVAVLVGSTEKMGVGTNIQARAIALHHLDCPWKPAEHAQRDGRILRQGNQNEAVHIIRYVTEGSFDTYLFQTVERKARFISQVMRGRLDTREIEDIGDDVLSYEEVKAIAAGDPRLLERASLAAEVTRLTRLERSHAQARGALAAKLDSLRVRERSLVGELARVGAATARAIPTSGEAFSMLLGATPYTERPAANAALLASCRELLDTAPGREPVELGALGGFPIRGSAWRLGDRRGVEVDLVGVPRSAITLEEAELDAGRTTQLVSRLEHRVARLSGLAAVVEEQLAATRVEAGRAREAADAPFRHAEALTGARARLAELDELFAREAAAKKEEASETPDRVEPEPTGLRAVWLEYLEVARGELTARVALATGAKGATFSRLFAAAARAELEGVDTTMTLLAFGDGRLDEEGAVARLAELAKASTPRLLDGLLPALPPSADGEAAERVEALARALGARTDEHMQALLAGGSLPPWAAGLGPRPVEAQRAQAWAAEVALVLSFHELADLGDGELLGAPGAAETRYGLVRRRVGEAAERAHRLVGSAAGRALRSRHLQRVASGHRHVPRP